MRYASSPYAMLFALFICFVQCAAMQHEESEHKDDPVIHAHTHRRPPHLCKECFDRILYTATGALMVAVATTIHEYLESQQYGCQQFIYEINPMRDTEFLLGNIACALCATGGAAYSLYEIAKIFVDVYNNPKSFCCLCKKIAHYLAQEERSQQENPTPVDPTQSVMSQQEV